MGIWKFSSKTMTPPAPEVWLPTEYPPVAEISASSSIWFGANSFVVLM